MLEAWLGSVAVAAERYAAIADEVTERDPDRGAYALSLAAGTAIAAGDTGAALASARRAAALLAGRVGVDRLHGPRDARDRARPARRAGARARRCCARRPPGSSARGSCPAATTWRRRCCGSRTTTLARRLLDPLLDARRAGRRHPRADVRARGPRPARVPHGPLARGPRRRRGVRAARRRHRAHRPARVQPRRARDRRGRARRPGCRDPRRAWPTRSPPATASP